MSVHPHLESAAGTTSNSLLYSLMTWLLKKAVGWILKCDIQGDIICSHSAKGLKTHGMELHRADGPEAYIKNNPRLFTWEKWNVLQRPSRSPDNHLSWIWLAEGKTEDRTPWEPTGSEDSCSKNLAELQQGRNSASGDVYEFQTSGSQWRKGFMN